MSSDKRVIAYEKAMRKFVDVCSIVVLIYTIIMFAVFPYYLRNAYSTSREDKYHFFVVVTLLLIGVIAALYAINYQSKPKSESVQIIKYCDRPWFNLVDISIVAFFSANVISAIFATIAGGDFIAFFNGDYGRNMGLFTLAMLVMAYFVISRLFCYKSGLFSVILIGMSFMSILAVINYYYIDPLHLFDNYSSQQHVIKNFTSTIGNKNYLSAMICVALPLAMGVAIATKDKITYIIANVCVGVQFMALIVATSDGGFLGCFVGIAVLFLYSAWDLKRLSKFFVCASIIILSSKILWLFDLFMKGNNKGYTSFSRLFIYNHYVLVLLPVFIALALLFAKLKDDRGIIAKRLFIAFGICLLVLFIVVVSLFAYFTLNLDVETNEFTSFFRFDEEWGTHRGFFWIRSFEMFKDFSFSEKLFGAGPDNFVEPFLIFDEELIERYNETHADAAHNVYINYLITSGFVGFSAYLLFIFAVLKNALSNAKDNPLSFMVLGSLVAYIVQDIVNLANPVNTPWLFLLIAISQASRLKSNLPKHSKEVF